MANDLDYVRETIENEGFDYAFCDYSSFDEVKDAEFHRLRKRYIESAEELKKYLGI